MKKAVAEPPVIPPNGHGTQQMGMKQFMDLALSREDKTRIYIMEKLLPVYQGEIERMLLEFVTEYPDFTYTKAMTKYETWIDTIKSMGDMNDKELKDTVGIVDTMTFAFMKKNVAHKRRGRHEIVNALRGEDVNQEQREREKAGLFGWFRGLR